MKSENVPNRPPYQESDSLMLALEPRILFDAAAALTMVEEFQDQPPEPAAEITPIVEKSQANSSDEILQAAAIELSTPARQELVVVDSAVRNYDSIIADVRNQSSPNVDFQIITLDRTKDGIQQISDTLEGDTKYEAIHILSHASDGKISLGNTELSGDNLTNYANQLTNWQNALNEEADILLYGCRVAETETGVEFVKYLSQLTEADIAASTDDTGHIDFYGDWDLEYQTGSIDTKIAFSTEIQESWHDIAIASGYTEYFIPGAADDLRQMFFEVDNAPEVSDELVSSVAVVASTDNTIVYYDHWEDGYEDFANTDPASFSPKTEIINLNAGELKVLETPSVEANPRDSGTIAYDGGDRLYVIGGPEIGRAHV